MTDVTDKNPLISDYPRDTLHKCAEALNWMTLMRPLEGVELTESDIAGRAVIEECIIAALRHEAEHAPLRRGEAHQPAA